MIQPVKTSLQIKTTAQLAHNIWNQHYVPIIGQDQVDYMVDKFQSETAITQQIQEGYQYFLIKHKSQPCGYLALVPDHDEGKLMISKIYVETNYRGLGLGYNLLDFTVKKAIDEGFNTIWLTVNINNTNTIQWYKKQGFEIKEKVEFDIGNGFIMDDYLLEKPI